VQQVGRTLGVAAPRPRPGVEPERPRQLQRRIGPSARLRDSLSLHRPPPLHRHLRRVPPHHVGADRRSLTAR
jgi:hypothetical protein